MRRVNRLVSNHSLSALLFCPNKNEHDFYLKLNSMPTFRKKYSKNFWKVLTNMHIPQELRIRSRGTERHSASN